MTYEKEHSAYYSFSDGIVLKNNACMDGTEILSIKLTKKIPFSVGEIIMFFNVNIFKLKS